MFDADKATAMEPHRQPVHIEPSWQEDLAREARNIPEKFENPSTVSVFGSSGTGKSSLINHLLKREAVPVYENTGESLETIQSDIEVEYKEKFKFIEVARAPKIKQVTEGGSVESGEKVKDFLNH